MLEITIYIHTAMWVPAGSEVKVKKNLKKEEIDFFSI
jgi:hypothetical protein